MWNILTLDKKGYANHPETKRWVGKLAALYNRHELDVAEMKSRGYSHQSELDSKMATGLSSQDVTLHSIEEQRKILKKKGCGCKTS
jgi:hypothetical protein